MKHRPAKVIFERTKLVLRGDRFLVYDRHGRVVLAVTMFLSHLLTYGLSRHTVNQYGRQIISVLRVLEVSSIALFDVNEATLVLLRDHALHVRGVKVDTWKSVLSRFLKMLVFAQKQHFCQGVIGVNADGEKTYRISLLPGEGLRHELLNQRGEGYEIVDLPSDGDFALVEAEMTAARTWHLRKQRHAMISLLHGGPLRRSELAEFGKNDIPSEPEFKRLVEKLRKSGSPPVIQVRFWRAKKQNDRRRSAWMTFELVAQLIDFRDKVRPHLLKEGIDPPQLFVSTKSGEKYNEQSITNLVKASARTAASKHGRHLKSIRTHFYRHRSATTTLKEHLRSGMEPVQAFLLVQGDMDVTFETMCRYLHLAGHEMNIESPEFNQASVALNNLAALRRRFYDAMYDMPRRRRGA